MRELIHLLFGLKRSVSRRAYVVAGFTLMVAKYAIDAGAISIATGAVWTPMDDLNPLFSARQSKWAGAPPWFVFAMALWTLPFLWIGVSMSVRRSLDAGLSGWLGLIFFVPLFNYVLMLALCILPRRQGLARARWLDSEVEQRQVSVLFSVLAGVFLVLGMVVFSVYMKRSYGPVLFLGAPFVLGVLTAVIHNFSGAKTYRSTIQVAIVSVTAAGGALMLFALEGAVCIGMAFSLALPLTVGGATLGWALVQAGRPSVMDLSLTLAALPALVFVEPYVASVGSFEVVTRIEVEAPPEAVWPHVIQFAELPEPEEWLFRTGIAYPVRARIEGTGVGAVRTCEFSTGGLRGADHRLGGAPSARLRRDLAARSHARVELLREGPPAAPRAFLQEHARRVPTRGATRRPHATGGQHLVRARHSPVVVLEDPLRAPGPHDPPSGPRPHQVAQRGVKR